MSADKNIPWCIHRLVDMIGRSGTGAQLDTQDDLGIWVSAVPLPYYSKIPDRFVAAWWIITGRAYAVTWPSAGDLERALGVYKVPKPSRVKRAAAAAMQEK